METQPSYNLLNITSLHNQYICFISYITGEYFLLFKFSFVQFEIFLQIWKFVHAKSIT